MEELYNLRSFSGADIGSDHQLVIAGIHLGFKGKPKPNYRKMYDVFKLKNLEIKINYEIEIPGRFAPLLSNEDTDVQTPWNGEKAAFNETSKKLLGNKKTHKTRAMDK